MPTFKEYKENMNLRWRSGIYSIDDDKLILHGGGNFYNPPENSKTGHIPDSETQRQAHAIARDCNKHILSMEGEWYGYSEYTPDPGDVSIFRWIDE